MKKSNLTIMSAPVAAILLAVVPSVPAYAALYDGGSTYCSAPTPYDYVNLAGTYGQCVAWN